MDEYITRHAREMDQYDRDKRVRDLRRRMGNLVRSGTGQPTGLPVAGGTACRDALVASLNFDIFAKHTDRLRGANIAQMVNVLQALMLTDGARMVKTPTYHVFDLYKDYGDGVVLPVEVASRWYDERVDPEGRQRERGARDRRRGAHAVTNVDPNRPATVSVTLQGVRGRSRSHPDRRDDGRAQHVRRAERGDAHRLFRRRAHQGGTLTVTLPAKSVVMLDIR
ncbi:alpha-L-arabinofuranosidase C-terminal domain-containing protein [Sphingomonas sp. MMS24-JH45]